MIHQSLQFSTLYLVGQDDIGSYNILLLAQVHYPFTHVGNYYFYIPKKTRF